MQVKILPISEKNSVYSSRIYEALRDSGIRCELDERPEKISYRIREAQMEKVPYMLITGTKEETDGTVSIRSRENGENRVLSLEKFIEELLSEIREKRR